MKALEGAFNKVLYFKNIVLDIFTGYSARKVLHALTEERGHGEPQRVQGRPRVLFIAESDGYGENNGHLESGFMIMTTKDTQNLILCKCQISTATEVRQYIRIRSAYYLFKTYDIHMTPNLR